jgi:hypothetical protein
MQIRKLDAGSFRIGGKKFTEERKQAVHIGTLKRPKVFLNAL